MSLPPGFLDELRSRTSLAQVAGRKVVWDMRKSNQGKGDWWAPCPFHQEKTPSFHVDDRQGFYYCFGCHAKGDAITFVKETENVSFIEAVEILAREAGMTMPAPDPKAQAKADRRSQLAEVMEAAVRHYRLQLKTAAAAPAREYLERRGLGPKALDRWEIGFAPDVRAGVLEHLKGQGASEDLIVAAGLAARPDDGSAAYDRFRGRIMFPIRDGRGRAIAFGGRAMDPNARAKYLNSPDTELFHKGRELFNHAPARQAAGKGAPLIVAEGYMDVIALAEAGFAAAVAPLGTAVTEEQLALIWRIAPEPIIALDGDAAGLRAAMRVIDMALPMLEPGRALRFALMPEGRDPDDVIREGGRPAMEKVIDAALPMVRLLWRRETEGKVFDSPERRAALDKALRDSILKIRDRSLRTHYAQEINRLRADLFAESRPARRRFQGRRGSAVSSLPTGTAKQSLLATSTDEFAEGILHEAVIVAVLVAHPALLAEYEPELDRVEFVAPEHREILHHAMRYQGDDAEGLRRHIDERLGPRALEKLFSLSHLHIVPALRRPGDLDMARKCVSEELAKLAALRGAEREIAHAIEDLEGVADEGVTWRLEQVAKARAESRSGGDDDETEFVTGPNGARISKSDREAFARLMEQIDYRKGNKRARE